MVAVGKVEQARQQVADACRILAAQGLVTGTLGHVSSSVDADRMLIRARGPADHGLAFTVAEDIRLVDFDGHGDDGQYALPHELPIHGEVLRIRKDVNAVVHAHPLPVLLCGLASLDIRPVFGAYNIPAMRMALEGVPVYPRSILINRPELAREMIDAMAGKSCCILYGHGITTVGTSVEQAVVRAVNLNALASVTLALAQLGRSAPDVTPSDLAELPDLGATFNDGGAWRCLLADAALSAQTVR